jgi:general stress protein 26
MLNTERSRRQFLQLSAAGAFGATYSGWLDVLASRAAETGTAPTGKAKACVLLWLDGGPSHKDTWDLKPDSKGAGEFKQIQTSAPGVMISEHLPKIAKWMHHGTVIRSMSTAEGAHPRAKYNMHTGYREGQGGVIYPSLGSLVSSELGKKEFAAPNYVSIGGRSYGSGFLGPKHQPLTVADPLKGVEDLRSLVSGKQFDNRVSLLEEMERAFHGEYQNSSINDHKTTYERAVRLMQSKEAKAFDLTSESAATKAAYGSDKFGQGCLMARRLIEVGVPFVEVGLGGWDTHQDNWTRVKANSEKLDAGFSALVSDLKERGLLDSTLIICMGEFGRTPHINTRGAKPGRDHYPKAWSMVMMGAGVKGGTVYGKTDKEGAMVEENKANAIDFMTTVCTLLGIDPAKENETANGRPIRIADKTGKLMGVVNG